MAEPIPMNLSRDEFRSWLSANHISEKECWVLAGRSEPCGTRMSYLDAVEEAICFGWIDSTRYTIDGKDAQRFSHRSSKSSWTELNLERARRMRRLGMMDISGLEACPRIDAPFEIDVELYAELLAVPGLVDAMETMPDLYIRIRLHNIQHYKGTSLYRGRLDRFIERTSAGKMYGPDWTDGGRLTENGCPLWKRPGL